MNCPLCRSQSIRLLETFLASRVVAGWRTNFNIDVAPELAGCEQFGMYSCLNCDLHFFVPALAGSDSLYSKLQHFDWYYMTQKWEHDAALEEVRTGSKVLEVGCGFGDYITRLISEKQVKGIGTEMNVTAVARARNMARPVLSASLKELMSTHRSTFDVVCSFQVLEHVAKPMEFLCDCVDLLKVGGRLQISVPNQDGFLRFARQDWLNLPPHHVSRWSKPVFEALEQLLPLRLDQLSYEPLAKYHLQSYTYAHLSRLPHVPLATGGLAWVGSILLRCTGAYHYLRGHSIYVSYEKKGIEI
jgi:SAM-dependent methyltransferase